MEIKSICVIGGGRMGRQIALNSAIYGFKAVVYDLKQEVCDDVKAWAEEYLAGRIAKGRMTAEKVAQVKELFSVESDLAKACEGVDCVVEAIIEVEEVKHNLFKQLSDILPETTIIATNSSAMVSSKFADDVKNPARLCNMHYYNPALVMKFVEVVQGPHTSEETAKACYDFCVATGKEPAWMKKELPGFLGNYVYGGISGRAQKVVNDGYCTPQEVDIALEYGFGAKMGPFRTNDLTGIDLSFDMKTAAYKRTGEKPPMYDLYKEMVEKGWLGRKSGRGFYDYTKPEEAVEQQIVEIPGQKVIKSVAVIGGGLMGRQIALNAAIYGFKASVYDLKDEVCTAVEQWAEEYLAGRIAKGRMTAEQVNEVKARFTVERDFNKAVAGADCVIEAIVEVEDIKRAVLKQISDAVPEDTIIATNSSVMVSSKFADCVANPARLCNMHYYNPALVMKFVEVVQGPHTSEETARACYNFCLKCDKKPVWMKKELPGFLGNYIIGGLQERAHWVVANEYCTPYDVDKAMEFGFNYKMGPFRTKDLTGIDTAFQILTNRYKRTGVKPDCYDMYKEMVEKGLLGRKTGKGFYEYK